LGGGGVEQSEGVNATAGIDTCAEKGHMQSERHSYGHSATSAWHMQAPTVLGSAVRQALHTCPKPGSVNMAPSPTDLDESPNDRHIQQLISLHHHCRGHTDTRAFTLMDSSIQL
jgi:hypothetical protein